jgi:hypothetical protein
MAAGASSTRIGRESRSTGEENEEDLAISKHAYEYKADG